MPGQTRTLHRALITGMGAVTPIGNTVAEFWEGLHTGRNGIARVQQFDPDGMLVQIAGEVKDFDVELYLERKIARRTGRFAQFAAAAGIQAFTDAGIELNDTMRDETGVVMATSGDAFNMGPEWVTYLERGSGKVDPFIITRMGQHMAAARVARELGIRGPNTTINTACASGTDALGHALSLIRLGHATAVLTGGAEAMVTQLALSSMGRMGALSKNNDDPTHASRPFDANRDGFVLGEGAGVILIESEASALARGARIYGELAGVGWSFDATDDTAPDADGQALAMTRAMRDAGITAAEIDYINAHGTSTAYNDRTETQAIKLALGEEQARRIPISSTKSMTGHLAAAAGGIEAVASVLALEHQCIPPTINYVTPDPECDLNVTPNEARSASLRVVLSNSFGLGGQNASAIFRKYEA
ncbi:MAG: beta-ketoacyl-[acyl-carrier-protein] synthase family protein [Chloroflexi bacterium]|nr:beta-ketoacyl-[acyl-carrier-protein] synthase family protein [Chloroflexota bacterium]MDA1003771.1 beta-ketoacyl-[acyl-carrier-protein] synthase family protein [Chloroflexota bacterium]